MKNESPKIKFDPFTFGDSAAAINLASILSTRECADIHRKVSAKIHKYQGLIKSCGFVAPLENKKWVLNIIMRDIRANVSKLDVEFKIKSHMINVLTANYRKQLNLTK